jgi:hypothetical protein
MSRHIDKRVIKAAAEALRALEPENEYVSARQAVAELEPDIRAAMDKGYTIDAIAKRLHEHIPISRNTLKGYLYGRDAVNQPPPAASARPRRKKSA